MPVHMRRHTLNTYTPGADTSPGYTSDTTYTWCRHQPRIHLRHHIHLVQTPAQDTPRKPHTPGADTSPGYTLDTIYTWCRHQPRIHLRHHIHLVQTPAQDTPRMSPLHTVLNVKQRCGKAICLIDQTITFCSRQQPPLRHTHTHHPFSPSHYSSSSPPPSATPPHPKKKLLAIMLQKGL